LDDFPRMDGSSIECPAEEIFNRDKPMSCVQVQEAEHLIIAASEMDPQKLRCTGGFR
jgi:hypothetical protein